MSDKNLLSAYEAMKLALSFFPDHYLQEPSIDERKKRIKSLCETADLIQKEVNSRFLSDDH